MTTVDETAPVLTRRESAASSVNSDLDVRMIHSKMGELVEGPFAVGDDHGGVGIRESLRGAVVVFNVEGIRRNVLLERLVPKETKSVLLTVREPKPEPEEWRGDLIPPSFRSGR